MRSQRRRAAALIAQGRKAKKRSDKARARQYYEQALALLREEYGAAHPWVANSLDRLGYALWICGIGDGGDGAAAWECFEQALAIRRRALGEDHPAVAESLHHLGFLSEYRGDYAAERGYHEQALAIRRRALGEGHPAVAKSLHHVAWASNNMEDYAAEQGYYEQLLAIRRRAFGEDHPDVAACLDALGTACWRLGDYAAARSYFEEALTIWRLFKDHPAVRGSLIELGTVCWEMGDYAAARGYLEEALAFSRRVYGEESRDVAEALTGLGAVGCELGDYAAARGCFEQALAIRGAYGASLSDHMAACGYRNLGIVSARLGDYAAARGWFEQALTIWQAPDAGAPREEAEGLNDLAKICREEGDFDRAGELLLEALDTALLFALLEDDTDLLSKTYQGLSDLQAARGCPEAAIFFGKQAVNAIRRQHRHGISDLPELQRSFLGTKETIYRALADRLVAAGRLGEAQQVLAMQKEEELFDLLRRDAAGDPRLTFAQLTSREAEWQHHGDALGQAHARLAEEVSALPDDPERSPEEEARLQPARAELDAARRAFRSWVDGLHCALAARSDLGAQTAALNLALRERQQSELRALGPGVAQVGYVLGDSRLSIILTTADRQVGREVAVAGRTVNRLVHEFRRALDRRRDEALPHAQELWRLLIAPIAPLLGELGVATLMIVPDGSLRYLPFAALHDGARYLVERCAVAMRTLAAPGNLPERPDPDWRVAGFGIGREAPDHGRVAAAELAGIVQASPEGSGVYPGTIRLDEAFTADSLAAALKTHQAVHIASPVVLHPPLGVGSHLRLGDGTTLTLERLRDAGFDFHGVERRRRCRRRSAPCSKTPTTPTPITGRPSC